MAIQVGGATVIDDNLNIININDATIGVVTFYGATGNVATSGTVFASGGIQTPIEISSFTVPNSAPNVGIGTSIGIIFDQTIERGTGSVEIRQGTVNGTVHSTYNVASSNNVVIQGNEFYLNPSSNLGVGTDIFLVVPSAGLKSPNAFLPSFAGVNVTGGTDYSFATINQSFVSIRPINGTNVGIGTSIGILFSSPPARGTGTITLRTTSATGTILETYNAATNTTSITIEGNEYVVTPQPGAIPYEADIFLVVPNTAIQFFLGLNVSGGELATYSFDTNVALGTFDAVLGGWLIKKGSGRYDIAAAQCAEAGSNWYGRNNAVTCAQTITGCTGWYVPSCGQLQTIGFACRAYWDERNRSYWSNTECNPAYAFTVSMNTGTFSRTYKPGTACIRAFRCVTY